MKSVWLDESVPVRLQRALASPTLHVRHSSLAGYKGTPDKALLDIVRTGGFDVFLTCDQSLPRQQNLTSLPFGTVVVCTNNWSTIVANLGDVVRAIDSVGAGLYVELLKGAHLTRYGRAPRAP